MASLKTPESPAFMLLGTTPSQIQRPSTPTGLAAALANGVTEGGELALLRNFALEISPFWLFPHPGLSYEDIVDDPWGALYRNLSLSAATGTTMLSIPDAQGVVSDVPASQLSVGARTDLVPGSPSSGARRCYRYVKGSLDAAAGVLADAKQLFLKGWDAENPRPLITPPPAPDPSDYVGRDEAFAADDAKWQRQVSSLGTLEDLVAWRERRDAAVALFLIEHQSTAPKDDDRFTHCLSALHARKGLLVSLAGAHGWTVPGGDLEKLDQGGSRTGVGWLTAAYVIENLFEADRDPIEGSATAVLRYEVEHGSPSGADAKIERRDAGLRLALALRSFGVAAEGTMRRQDGPAGEESLYRLALSVDYRVQGGMWITGTFGKDFGDTQNEVPILALANLQWNFGLERGVRPDESASR